MQNYKFLNHIVPWNVFFAIICIPTAGKLVDVMGIPLSISIYYDLLVARIIKNVPPHAQYSPDFPRTRFQRESEERSRSLQQIPVGVRTRLSKSLRVFR
jgi:hypothetical protein